MPTSAHAKTAPSDHTITAKDIKSKSLSAGLGANGVTGFEVVTVNSAYASDTLEISWLATGGSNTTNPHRLSATITCAKVG